MPILGSTDLPTIACGNTLKRKTEAISTQPSKSTLWRHANNEPSRRDKAANQQYLTPRERKSLLGYVLRISGRGYPLPIKFLRSIALVIVHQRCSTF